MIKIELLDVAYHKVVFSDIFALGWLAEQLSGQCGEWKRPVVAGVCGCEERIALLMRYEKGRVKQRNAEWFGREGWDGWECGHAVMRSTAMEKSHWCPFWEERVCVRTLGGRKGVYVSAMGFTISTSDFYSRIFLINAKIQLRTII